MISISSSNQWINKLTKNVVPVLLSNCKFFKMESYGFIRASWIFRTNHVFYFSRSCLPRVAWHVEQIYTSSITRWNRLLGITLCLLTCNVCCHFNCTLLLWFWFWGILHNNDLAIIRTKSSMGHVILGMLEATQLFSIDSLMILNNQHTFLKK